MKIGYSFRTDNSTPRRKHPEVQARHRQGHAEGAHGSLGNCPLAIRSHHYHFLMVPLTIGLGLLVARMQTRWHRTGKERDRRMTKFWGKLFLIDVIMGVAAGFVEEFQFGMAWSEYRRFVGDGARSMLGDPRAGFTDRAVLLVTHDAPEMRGCDDVVEVVTPADAA